MKRLSQDSRRLFRTTIHAWLSLVACVLFVGPVAAQSSGFKDLFGDSLAPKPMGKPEFKGFPEKPEKLRGK